jgi:tRNA (cmo5U34)-methyltransferase
VRQGTELCAPQLTVPAEGTKVNGFRPLWRIPGIVARERRHPAGRERTPEPMVMDDPESVAQFHAAGASNPGIQAVYDLGSRALDALLPAGAQLLDLGVGSGRALAAVLRRRPDLEVTAVDLAPNMLATAQELLRIEGFDGRVELVQADITALPERLARGAWNGVSCMWTLHQLPDFDGLRAALRQIADVRRHSGAAMWISDFQRLRDPSTASAMLRCVDPSITSVAYKDALASEAAAFTHAELSSGLAAAGLGGVQYGFARPLPYLQAYWMRAAGAKASASLGRHTPLPGPARRDAALLRWGFTAKPF